MIRMCTSFRESTVRLNEKLQQKTCPTHFFHVFFFEPAMPYGRHRPPNTRTRNSFFFFRLECWTKVNNIPPPMNANVKGQVHSQSLLSHRLSVHWASPESDSSSKQTFVIGLLYVDPMALTSTLLTSPSGPAGNASVTSSIGHWCRGTL